MLIFFALMGFVVVTGILGGLFMIFSAFRKPGPRSSVDYLSVSNNQELVKQTEIMRRQLELSVIDRKNDNLGDN